MTVMPMISPSSTNWPAPSARTGWRRTVARLEELALGDPAQRLQYIWYMHTHAHAEQANQEREGDGRGVAEQLGCAIEAVAAGKTRDGCGATNGGNQSPFGASADAPADNRTASLLPFRWQVRRGLSLLSAFLFFNISSAGYCPHTCLPRCSSSTRRLDVAVGRNRHSQRPSPCRLHLRCRYKTSTLSGP